MNPTNIFPHASSSHSSTLSRSEVTIDGMKVKFDKVASLVPTELTTQDGKTLVQSMSLGYSRAFDSLVFDAEKCIEVEYESPGNESLGEVVARNFAGLSAEEMSKAINFHVKELRRRNILQTEQLLEGQVIPVWIYMGDMQPVVIEATKPAAPEEMRILALAMFDAFHEGQREALGRLKNILWWPEKESLKENVLASGFIWGVFKLVIAVSKDLMPKSVKYITEFSVGAVETIFKDWVFSYKGQKPPSKTRQTFDWVQDYEFYLGHISKNKEDMAKAFALKWAEKRNVIAREMPEKLGEFDAYSRKMMKDTQTKFRDNFSVELMILSKFFSAIHPGVKVAIRYHHGEKIPYYQGLSGVPEDKLALLNAEYNRLADALQWHYMQFYKIGLTTEVSVGDRNTRPALTPQMSWTGTGLWKSEKWSLSNHFRDKSQYPNIAGKVYYYDYPLSIPGYEDDPWKEVRQESFRLPFPVRFTE